MPLGSYPGRVKDFKKWSAGMIDKADISNRATSSTTRSRKGARSRRRRSQRRLKRGKKED